MVSQGGTMTMMEISRNGNTTTIVYGVLLELMNIHLELPGATGKAIPLLILEDNLSIRDH